MFSSTAPTKLLLQELLTDFYMLYPRSVLSSHWPDIKQHWALLSTSSLKYFLRLTSPGFAPTPYFLSSQSFCWFVLISMASKYGLLGTPGWHSWLRLQLLISAQVMISCEIKPSIKLCAQRGACLRFSPSPSALSSSPHLHVLHLSLSQMNK